VNEIRFFNPAFLSETAVQLRDRVVRGHHVKGGITWVGTFTGRDLVVSSAKLLWVPLWLTIQKDHHPILPSFFHARRIARPPLRSYHRSVAPIAALDGRSGLGYQADPRLV
jgi:hypothetical protein